MVKITLVNITKNIRIHHIGSHSSYWFALHLDKHRGGFESILYNNCDNERTLAEYKGNDNEESAIMILEVLEKTYEVLVNEDCLGESEE